MSKYLIKAQQYYVDPHGSYDKGKVYLEVVEPNERWDYICNHDGYTYYNYIGKYNTRIETLSDEEWNMSIDPDNDGLEYDNPFVSDDYCAKDGYNAVCWGHSLKVITDEEAVEYANIINKYNDLTNLF